MAFKASAPPDVLHVFEGLALAVDFEGGVFFYLFSCVVVVGA
jgi:hypothetical protein